MKKLATLFLLILIPIIGVCNTVYYQSNEFAFKIVGGYWSDWEESSILISIDTDRDLIIVHTNQPQRYKIIEYMGEYEDNKGGYQIRFKVIDQDGDIGIVRIRRQANGVAQLYIEYSDIMWVYSKLVVI